MMVLGVLKGILTYAGMGLEMINHQVENAGNEKITNLVNWLQMFCRIL